MWDCRDLTLIHKFPQKSHLQLHCDVGPESEYLLSSGSGTINDGSEITVNFVHVFWNYSN